MVVREQLIADPAPPTPDAQPRLCICVLGSLTVLASGQPLVVRGRKSETLLALLALHHEQALSRDRLLSLLWEETDDGLAGQALNNLVYSLNKLFGPFLSGARAITSANSAYQLNRRAGVEVDAHRFATLVAAGQAHEQQRQQAAASLCYERAIGLYRGDLQIISEASVQAEIEQERLRSLYLAALARLGTFRYLLGDYTRCLGYAAQMLNCDPYREDAHRLMMRAYVQRGERAQALRQYRLCTDLLRLEFDALPECATRQLFETIRLNQDSQ